MGLLTARLPDLGVELQVRDIVCQEQPLEGAAVEGPGRDQAQKARQDFMGKAATGFTSDCDIIQ